jgi:tetratricopeptide (TPR) repeat protein
LTRDEQRQLSKRGTDNAEAFEAYLRGRYHWNFYSEVGLAKALQSYQKAISLDPDYALAYTGIADYYNWLGVFGLKPFAECSAAAKQAASKAVELDSSSAEAYSALGFATVCHDFDWAVAEGQHRRALEINPNYATGHNWYAFHLAMEGRSDEAIEQMMRTRELDPLSPAVLQALGWCYYQGRRFDEAIATFRAMLEAVPDFAYGLVTLSWLLRHTGATDEAVRVAEKALALSSGNTFYLSAVGAAYAAAGQETEARKVLDQLDQAAAHGHVSPYHLALIHLHLGDRERALECLLEAHTIKDAWIVWLGVEPQWDPMRGEPAFDQILRDLRHPALGRKPSRAAAARERRQKRGSHIAPITSQIAIPTPETKTGENEEARQLYTAGRYYSTRRTAEGLRQAIERLERAVELDPDFAIAHAELADCYALLNWYVEPPPAHAWERAKESALAAVEADPQLADAHASLGFVKLHYDRDWIAAERELRKAIQLKPGNQVAHRWYAYSLSAMGRHDEAYAEIERARQISPQSAVIATGVANVLFLAGKFDECIKQCKKALELDPGAVAAHTVLRWAYEGKGMHNEVMAAFEQERSFAGDTPTTHAKRAHVLAAIGKHEEARAILDEIISKRNQNWVTAYEIAIIYTLVGDFDNAFRWLKQAEREHAVGFTFVRVDPHLRRLRADPRFIDLLRETEKTIP